jgi:hypothetical protein
MYGRHEQKISSLSLEGSVTDIKSKVDRLLDQAEDTAL